MINRPNFESQTLVEVASDLRLVGSKLCFVLLTKLLVVLFSLSTRLFKFL